MRCRLAQRGLGNLAQVTLELGDSPTQLGPALQHQPCLLANKRQLAFLKFAQFGFRLQQLLAAGVNLILPGCHDPPHLRAIFRADVDGLRQPARLGR